MKKQIFLTAILLALVSINVQAQSTNAPQTKPAVDETNLETQLYLIVGSNQDVADPKLPAALDDVVKQLRATLPFKNYRLASTLINRVKNEGRLDLNWIGGPLTSALGPNTITAPSFSHFKIRHVTLSRDAEGQQMIQMLGFNFGARIPIPASGTVANNEKAPPPYNYEGTGLATDISMREGEPIIVGTLNVGPSGDAVILVVSARRTQR